MPGISWSSVPWKSLSLLWSRRRPGRPKCPNCHPGCGSEEGGFNNCSELTAVLSYSQCSSWGDTEPSAWATRSWRSSVAVRWPRFCLSQCWVGSSLDKPMIKLYNNNNGNNDLIKLIVTSHDVIMTAENTFMNTAAAAAEKIMTTRRKCVLFACSKSHLP